jgi:hypothetical protein
MTNPIRPEMMIAAIAAAVRTASHRAPTVCNCLISARYAAIVVRHVGP